MSDTSRTIAVLTGDLINSTAMSQNALETAISALRTCAGVQETWMGSPLFFTRHRGDGWQVVLANPALSLRSAITFRAALKALDAGFDSAIGIAEGTVTSTIGPDLNAATEGPFVVSGRALDIARRSRPNMNHARGGAFEAATILADRVCREWTAAQARAVSHALHPLNDPDHTEIGRKLGKSRQAVSKALRAAWCDEMRLALTMLESAYA